MCVCVCFGVMFYVCFVSFVSLFDIGEKIGLIVPANPIVINPFSSGLKWVHKSFAITDPLSMREWDRKRNDFFLWTRKKKKCEIMNELRIAWSYHVSLPCTEHTRQNIVSKFEMGMFRCTNRELDSLKSRTATHSHKYTREKRPKVSTTGRQKKKQSMAKRNEMNWFYHQIPYYENNPKSPAPIISNHSSFTWRTQNWWKRKRECGHTVFSDQHSSFISSLVDAK